MNSNAEHRHLLVKVALYYYEQNLTQAEIAKRMRLSRPKVQRLLKQASEQGVVRITIHPLTGTFAELEREMEERFDLREVVIVEVINPDDPVSVTRQVGAGAAEYLMRIVQLEDRIVLSWGSALLSMIDALSAKIPAHGKGIKIIQGLGGLGDPSMELHAAELTRRLAKALAAQAVLMPAPGLTASRSTRDLLYNDPYVSEVLQMARSADLAFMTLGVRRPDTLLAMEGSLINWDGLTSIVQRGAVGHINLRYIDENGQLIPSDLDERVLGLTLEEIKKIDIVVGVVGGAIKAKAIVGALRGKLLDVLITDHVTAQIVLAMK